jgi:hypothetical protein
MTVGSKVNLLTEEEILDIHGTGIEEGTEVIDNDSWICGIGTRQRNFLGKYVYFKANEGKYIVDLNGFFWPKEVIKDKIA